MGHAIDFISVPENTSKENRYKESVDFARCNVDREENPSGSYGNYWKEYNHICDSYEEAEDFLYSKGAYHDGCVRYREYPAGKSTKKEIELEKRIEKIHDQRETFRKGHSVSTLKAKLITCPECGSKIAREYLESENCPVCGTDMRAKYIIEKIAFYDEKERILTEELSNEKKKNARKKKATIKWLIKTEVHC